MDSVARTAHPVAGPGQATILSNGTRQTLIADAKLGDPIQVHHLPTTTLMEVLVLISLTENAARTATLAPGLGHQMTLSSGTQLAPRADASRAAQTEAQMVGQTIVQMTTPMEVLVLISMTANAERTATPAPGLGPPMTLSNGTQLAPHADASRAAQMVETTAGQMTETTHQTQMIQLISMSLAMPAVPTLTMIAL